jgi:3D (Asp-Asp-Asp) domain-containing protein
MNCFAVFIISLVALSGHACAGEQSLLARITVYWHSEGSGQRASWNGARLRAGHCAVDPKRIPFGSKVVFPDADCVAVDSGPDVVNRKAARSCGRTVSQRAAIVVDRFFETRQEALSWAKKFPQFLTLRVLTADARARRPRAVAAMRPPTSARCDLQAMFDSSDIAVLSPASKGAARPARRRT